MSQEEWRERFSDDEWELVRHVPMDVFYMVAMADAELGAKEAEVLARELATAAELKNPLHRAIALDIGAGDHLSEEVRFEAWQGGPDMKERMDRTKALLKDRLTPEEYASFFGSVLVTGIKTAWAGTSGQAEMDEKEAMALTAFATEFEIDAETALRQYQQD